MASLEDIDIDILYDGQLIRLKQLKGELDHIREREETFNLYIYIHIYIANSMLCLMCMCKNISERED